MTEADQVAVVQNAFWLTAENLLLRHTNPWELDEGLMAWGYGMGPCEAQDLFGLDQVLARHPKRKVSILSRMVSEGRLGKIGGVGYYRYPGGGGAVIDPLIEDLIREEAWFASVERVEICDRDLVNAMNTTLRKLVKVRGIDPCLLAKAVSFPPDQNL